MKLVAVTFAYHPDVEDLRNNVLQYLDDVEHLIIWDNSPEDRLPEKLVFDEEHKSKVEFMGIGENVGIAYAANRVVEWGIRNGYSHILTMDQDSRWKDFHSYRTHIEQDADANVGIYSPVFEMWDRLHIIDDTVWTSGAVIPLPVFREIGLFNEYYVIEAVDREYYNRCVVSGYSTKVMLDIMAHEFGKRQVIKGRDSFNYSPSRLYYLSRNELCLWKDYKNSSLEIPPSFRAATRYCLSILKTILLCEDDKLKKLSAIIKGYMAGLMYNPEKHKIQFPQL